MTINVQVRSNVIYCDYFGKGRNEIARLTDISPASVGNILKRYEESLIPAQKRHANELKEIFRIYIEARKKISAGEEDSSLRDLVYNVSSLQNGYCSGSFRMSDFSEIVEDIILNAACLEDDDQPTNNKVEPWGFRKLMIFAIGIFLISQIPDA